MAQSAAFDTQLSSLKTSIQTMVQAIVQANLNAQTADNALALEGYSYQDIVDNIMGATSMTISDLSAELDSHEARTDNPHAVTKEQVGLALVENFALSVKADLMAKTPVEIYGINNQYTTPQTAYYLAEKAIEQISGTAPETLDTINEIAAALNNNPDVITNILDSLGTKASTTDLNDALAALTKADIGLGNVDNFATATDAEAKIAATADKFMTPKTTHVVVEDAVLRMMGDLEAEFNTGAGLINPV